MIIIFWMSSPSSVPDFQMIDMRKGQLITKLETDMQNQNDSTKIIPNLLI